LLDTVEDEKPFLYAVDSLPESLAGHLVSYQRSGRVGNSIPERVKGVKALLKSFSLTESEMRKQFFCSHNVNEIGEI
jgi:hypothetical protein